MNEATKKFKYLHGARSCYHNTNNLPDLAPFDYDDVTDTLIVEAEQYDAWAATNALGMLNFKGGVVRADAPIVGIKARCFADAPLWLLRVYNPINLRSNARWWWSELIFEGGVIPVADEQSEMLASGASEARAWLREEMQSVMDKHPEVVDGWFVKCGACSTKHQYPPEPVYSSAEAVMHVLGAKPILEALEKKRALCFAMRPWVNQISDNNEFRAFVRGGKVTGVSQQACYTHVVNILAMFPPKDVIEAAQACYDNAMQKLPPARRFVHQCTFDAYLSCPNETLGVHLIEINGEAFGWGPSGSSLFDWRNDPPPMQNEPPVVYVVV
jgi:hypothetical protein